jgi:prevent-host-death family protein
MGKERRVGVRELRQDASKLLEHVKAGETLIITEHGKPVATLGPIVVSAWDAAIEAGLIIPPTSEVDWRTIKPMKWPGKGSPLDQLFADRDAE